MEVVTKFQPDISTRSYYIFVLQDCIEAEIVGINIGSNLIVVM